MYCCVHCARSVVLDDVARWSGPAGGPNVVCARCAPLLQAARPDTAAYLHALRAAGIIE